MIILLLLYEHSQEVTPSPSNHRVIHGQFSWEAWNYSINLPLQLFPVLCKANGLHFDCDYAKSRFVLDELK